MAPGGIARRHGFSALEEGESLEDQLAETEELYRDYLLHGMKESIPEEIKGQIFEFRYRSHFKLSVREMREEPWEAQWQAAIIWGLEEEAQAARANREQ